MTPERWKKLEAVFHEAVGLRGEARVAFLAEACGGDGQLRAEAERLLAASESGSSLMDLPILAEAAELTAGDRHPSLVGYGIGPYQVISLLGVGGIGMLVVEQLVRCGFQS